MKKIFLFLFLISFFAFDCSETPIILESICKITSDICYYSEEICKLVPKENNVEFQNDELKQNIYLIRNSLQLYNSSVKNLDRSFTDEDLEKLKLHLFEIREKLKLQLLEMKGE